MKIRLMGSLEELEQAIEKLTMVFQIVRISKPYKNRNSEEYRVYLDVD